MTGLPLLASLFMLTHIDGPLSGQVAMDRVKSSLKAFGVLDNLRMQELSPVSANNKTMAWHVVLTDAHKSRYEAYVQVEGRGFHIWRGSERVTLNGLKSSPLTDKKYEKLTRKWLAAVAGGETTRLKEIVVNEKGLGHAHYSIIRNGHPFVSHPRYEYEFIFNVQGGEFAGLRADTKPPDVDSTPPKLDKAAALAALKRIWDTEVAPQAIKVQHFKRVWYENVKEPELGYYLPQGKSKAILVWKLSFMAYRDVVHAIQGGDNGMLIDAVTGQRIQTNAVP